MKKIDKIFLYIGILFVIIGVLVFVLPYIVEPKHVDGFWPLVWIVWIIPGLVCADALLLFIHNIITSQKLLSIRIFRWVQGILATPILLWFLLSLITIDDILIAVYLVVIVIISLWIAEIAVRLVIRHRNKKAIKKAE